jgi:hypothetical protein
MLSVLWVVGWGRCQMALGRWRTDRLSFGASAVAVII